MTDVLTFWMTVVGTVAGVVSMWIAYLDRRGPREPRRKPGKIAEFFATLILLFLFFVLPYAPLVINIGAVWLHFELPVWTAITGVLLNICGTWAHNSVNSEAEKRGRRRAYTLFCLTFAVLFAIAGVAEYRS
ncbi:hypothetical protein ACIRD0_37205 [Streptomyces microflavus]|uniref:hypothetical protein n=1 Tax=Streptomyces microflavus TaxID=1919 RepID=UPI00382F3B85